MHRLFDRTDEPKDREYWSDRISELSKEIRSLRCEDMPAGKPRETCFQTHDRLMKEYNHASEVFYSFGKTEKDELPDILES